MILFSPSQKLTQSTSVGCNVLNCVAEGLLQKCQMTGNNGLLIPSKLCTLS